MPALLVTGASGLVGRELVARLSRVKPGFRIYLLTRDPDRIPAAFRGSRFQILTGDITQPGLGLSDWQLTALRRSVNEIVHCAADTALEQTITQARLTNVTGTENLLRLAADCSRLNKFLHVSTVYVAGRCPGRIPEETFTHSARFSNTHQQSKYDAEHLVTSYAMNVPVAIARLSTIGGDTNGVVSRKNCLHDLIELFPKCGLAVIPYEPAMLLDVIASDWAADALAYLFENRFQAGAVWHVCYGPSAGLSLEEALAETHRIFAHHPRAQQWLPVQLPRRVPLDEYEEFVERTLSTGSWLMRELVRAVSYYLPHLGIVQEFENHKTNALLRQSGIQPPPARELYAGVVRWCLDTGWGRLG